MMKLKLIAFGGLALLILALGIHYRVTVARAATLKANNAQLVASLETHKQALAIMEAERERLERVLADRARRQAEIEARARRDLERANQELATLRGQYEDVDAFLRLLVPGEFVNWMRTKNGDADGSAADTATGGPAPANALP
jgi:uncharacterized protein (DUF3084 family)